MAIAVRIEPNPLQAGSYRLRPQRAVEMTQEELIEGIMSASALTEAEILGVHSSERELLVAALCHNRSVRLPGVGRLYITLRGAFSRPPKRLKKEQVSLRINLKVDDKLLKDVFRRMRFETVKATARRPLIGSVVDGLGRQSNRYRPGQLIRIRGKNLKLTDPAAADVGAFLQPQAGGREIKLDEIVLNGPTRLWVMVPATIGGPQKLFVKNRYTAQGSLRVTEHPSMLKPL